MTKILSCTLILIGLGLPGVASAQSGISLDHVDGLYGSSTDSLRVGVPVKFHLRLTNNTGFSTVGYTNGFSVSSSTGAQWGTTIADSTGTIAGSMVGQQFVNLFSIDGAGADTVGFGGFSIFAPGIPNGFDQIVWEISIGPIDSQYHQGEICLDSSFYPPANTWLWSTGGGNIVPEWDGPHCYTIFNPNAPPDNAPPVLAPIGPQSVSENQLLSFGTSATDPDGTTPAMTTSALPTGATYTDNFDGTGSFSWTPDFSQAGTYNISFYAYDGTDTDSEQVVITVNNVNRPPILAAIGPQSGTENSLLTFGTSATDADGATPTMTSSTLPAGATYTDNLDGTGLFNWTPTVGQAGTYNVSFYASDGIDTDSEQVVITIAAVNNPPVLAAIAPQNGSEDNLLTFGTSATDADGTTPLMTGSALPAGASYTDNGDGTGTFNWTPGFFDAGVYTAVFFAIDAVNPALYDSQLVTITIADSNRAPISFIPPSQPDTVNEGDIITVTVLGFDPDSTQPSIVAFLDGTDSLATNMTFSTQYDPVTGLTEGTLTFAPDFTQGAFPYGFYYFRFTICDEFDAGLCNTTPPFTIRVIDVNQAPILAPISNKNVVVGVTLSFGVSATDPDGDPLSLGMTAPALPPQAIFVDNGDGTGQFDWTPTAADVGSYPVTFDASDGGLTDSQSITINVIAQGGAFLAEMIIDPDTMYSLFQFSIDSATGTILLGNITSGHTVDDINQSSLLINSSIVPLSLTILDSSPGFTGRVLEINYPMVSFIQSYGLLWDYSEQPYTVSGSLNDQSSFELSNLVPFRGHISGDINLDGSVDISDVTLLIDYIFRGGRPLRLPEVADVNRDGEIDVSDLTILIKMVFF